MFSESQIVGFLKHADEALSVAGLPREFGVRDSRSLRDGEGPQAETARERRTPWPSVSES